MDWKLVCAAGLALAGPEMAFAATYSMSGMIFETQTRQSTWSPSDAAELSGTVFAGATWDEAFRTGEIVGNISTTTVRDITYSTRLAAWEACRDSFFSSFCGSRPTDGSFNVTVDTRTGVVADVETSGKAGFDLNYTLGAGSLGASIEYGATALLPEADTVRAGTPFALITGSVFADGEIDVRSPTIEASIDAVLKIDAHATATGCVALAGCVSGSGTILQVDEDRELLGIDLNEIRYLDGFTPTGFDLSTSLANQSATLQAGITALGVPAVVVDAPFLPKPPGIYTDLGQVELTVPLFAETGGMVGDSLMVNARADFLDLTVDLDTLFGLPGGFSTSFGPLGVGLDAYDFDAGPSLDVFQDLTLTPRLMVDFDFSKPVEVAGQLVTSLTSAWDALPDFTIFERTRFTPTFFVEAMLTSVTGLQIGLELSMDFLKAHLGLAAFDFELLGLDIGPLFHLEFPFEPDWAKLGIYDTDFMLGGLNRLQGASFVLAPYATAAPAPVPGPLGLPLLVSALGGLALLRRRRR